MGYKPLNDLPFKTQVVAYNNLTGGVINKWNMHISFEYTQPLHKNN